MPSVAELTKPSILERLATPSDYRLGQEILANDNVEIETLTPSLVVAHATGGQRRLVELRATPDDDLSFSCTCSGRLDRPCKHIVAVGLKINA